MTRRQSGLAFVAFAVLIIGFWAPTAIAEGNTRMLLGARAMNGISVDVSEKTFALGAWKGSVRRVKGFTIDESGISEARELELSLTALPRKLVFEGVRPFVETGVAINALEPDGFARSGGGSTILRSTRWRVGGGLAIPIEIASYKVNLKPSLLYAFTNAKQSFGVGSGSRSSRRHAIQLSLATVIPIGEMGPLEMSVGLGARAHVPVSGDGSVGPEIAAGGGIEVQGGIGIHAEFSGLIGYSFQGAKRLVCGC